MVNLITNIPHAKLKSTRTTGQKIKIWTAAIGAMIFAFFAQITLESRKATADLPPGPAKIDEVRALLDDSLNLSRQLYLSGKYALCLAELEKMSQYKSNYKNSQELRALCEQGKKSLTKVGAI
jgi:hypothetical protein